MKTKKSFRKKALLSSVAMLLVAAVAVGSATFAWFTQNTTARANGVYVKTMRGSSLLVSPKNLHWGPEIDYKLGNSDSPHAMYPASTIDNSNWVHAHADPESGAVIKPVDTVSVDYSTGAYPNTSGNNINKYVYKNMLNVQNEADAASGKTYSDVKILCTNPSALGDYGRIALVPCDDQTGSTESATFTNCVYAFTETKTNGLGTDGNEGEEYTAKGLTSSTPLVTPFTLSAGGAGATKYFNLYIWFEGQDSDCTDSNAECTIQNLQFTVTGTAN